MRFPKESHVLRTRKSMALCVMPAGNAAMGPLFPHQGASMCASSLQFSLEVEEEQATNACSSTCSLARHHQARAFCQCAANPEGLFCAQLVLDVRHLARQLQREAADGSSVDVVELGSRLSTMGYRITVRTALGGGPACFRNLRHEFLTVLGEGDYRDVPYFVDPAFKEQFEIPQPSPSYAALLDLLPAEFVGTSSRLVPLVQNLCAEMVASFEANSLTLPPWRRAQSMLTKWLPSKSRDVAISVHTDTGGSSSSPGACCSGHSPGSSPPDTAATAAAGGGSPFSRIEDHQICRQGSGRSLLSGKLGSAGSSSGRCLGRSNSSISASSSSTMAYAAPASSAQASSGASLQSTQQLLQQQQQLVVGGGAISRQPSLYQGQPATYTVKMGALRPASSQQRQQQQ